MQRSATFLISLVLVTTTAAGGLYRWVDEDGNVHYSDSVPPQQIEGEHTILNQDGVRVKSVPRAKTPEELQKEQEIERMRAQQQELLDRQQELDQALLRTFRSEDDIVMARDGKIAAVEVKIDVIRNNIRRGQDKLSELLKQAADLERAGRGVPNQVKEKILKTEREIGSAYEGILEGEQQKEAVRATFEADLERFRLLKNITASSVATPEPETSRPLVHNILACTDQQECDRLWGSATDYVRRSATTPVQTSTDSVVITARPASEDDISLILSRIRDKKGGGASLFLDLQCVDSTRGNAMCRNPKAQEVIEGFRPAVLGEDKS